MPTEVCSSEVLSGINLNPTDVSGDKLPVWHCVILCYSVTLLHILKLIHFKISKFYKTKNEKYHSVLSSVLVPLLYL